MYLFSELRSQGNPPKKIVLSEITVTWFAIFLIDCILWLHFGLETSASGNNGRLVTYLLIW
jgi:hypothetical protein